MRASDGFPLKHVVMALFILCNVVSAEWFLFQLNRLVMCGMLFMMYKSVVYSSIIEISKMGLYLSRLLCLCGSGMVMMSTSFQ